MSWLSRLVEAGATKAAPVAPMSWAPDAWTSRGFDFGDREGIANDFESYCQEAFKACGPVFGTIAVRQLVFSEARFLWRDALTNGSYGDVFGTLELGLLERPWPGGTTGDLLSRMEQDASLAGNCYLTTVDDRARFGEASVGGPGRRVVRMRPDKVKLIIDSASGDPRDLDARCVGYQYRPGSGRPPVLLLPSEVSHYSPYPDPEARFRGMSWLTPVLSEIAGDVAATKHKIQFFKRGAHIQQAITFAKEVSDDEADRFAQRFNTAYAGSKVAYRTLVLTGGADIKAIGADLKQLDFKAVQGHGETRIAMAGGVPPIIVGLSEGLEAATYSNYGQARRRLADATMRPLWRIAAASLQNLLAPPSSRSQLTAVTDHIAFLREDQLDAVQIQATEAQTIRTLVDAGYTPESVVTALRTADWRSLVHSGAYSVQLQPPTTTPAGAAA